MKKKLKFIRDAIYNGEVVHKLGEVLDIENDKGMADRWIKRAVAVEFVAAPNKPAAPVKPAAPAAPAEPQGKNPAPALANDKDGKDNIAEKDL